MILRNYKGQIAGELRDGIYRKVVERKKHLMKMFDGYGIDKHILDILEKDCTKIRLLEKDTKKIYETTPGVFMEKGITKNFDGEQVFLSLKYWVAENTENLTLF